MVEVPESRQRRLLELRLLHHYTTTTSLTVLGDTQSSMTAVYQDVFPRLALENDAFLYVLYAIAALQLAKTDPHDREAIVAHRTYLDLALIAHRQDVAQLSQSNADVACLTSSMIRIGAFAILQDRPLHPYRPPMQWLQMTSGTGLVLQEAWRWIGDDQSSVALRMLSRQPALSPFNENLFAASNRQGLEHLLEPGDLGPAEVYDAYATTVSYLGSVRLAVAAGETRADICRRLLAFPMLIPARFIGLVEEQQPRALAILAHYFALLSTCSDVWWVGHSGARESRRIREVLPDEWQHLLRELSDD